MIGLFVSLLLLAHPLDPGPGLFSIECELIGAPLRTTEWKIRVARHETGTVIVIENYHGHSGARVLDPEDYLELVKSITRLGIWHLTDSGRPGRSPNPWYKISIRDTKSSNVFLAEKGMTGTEKAHRIEQIIRLLENRADLSFFRD